MLQKRVLVISSNYGMGHLIAAKSIKQLLEDENEVLLLDTVEDGTSAEKALAKLHILVWRYIPALWRAIYHNSLSRRKMLKTFFKYTINRRLYENIRSFEPDVIISTNPYATTYGIKYKKEQPNTKLFVCITDFWVHPFWLYDEVDLYFLPSDYSLRFFDSTNYIVTGIPLRKGFWKEVDKEKIRRKLDIRTDKLVVLMNLGANSILPMGDTIAYINKFRESLYFLIVVGKDKRRYNMLFDRLKRYKNLDFKLFSFVEDIHNLIFACDFCITKAGGVTVSELIYTKTPAIYYRSLPGQEEGNQEYIKESGLGLIAKKFEQLTSLTKLVIENPYILEFISNNLRNQRKGMDFFKIKDIVAEERLPDYESDFDLWYPGSGVLPV